MLELNFYHSSHLEALCAYRLDELQTAFVSMPFDVLVGKNILDQSEKFPISILYRERPIGFLLLDWSCDKFQVTDNPNALLLRSFSINPQFQGLGLGKASLQEVDLFIQEHFPLCDEIVLMVNQRNTAAQEVYAKTGYCNYNQDFMGILEPQRVMGKRLEVAVALAQ